MFAKWILFEILVYTSIAFKLKAVKYLLYLLCWPGNCTSLHILNTITWPVISEELISQT